jgi:hypothetical protein
MKTTILPELTLILVVGFCAYHLLTWLARHNLSALSIALETLGLK